MPRAWPTRLLHWVLPLFLWAAAAEGQTPEESLILCLGDSLTAGFGVSRAASYPSLLQQKLFLERKSFRVLNAGVSGDTSADALARLPSLLGSRPAIAIVALGANDIFQGVPPERLRENLARIIETLREAGVKVLLGGMRNLTQKTAPDPHGAVYPELARHYGVPLIPFFLEGVAGKRRWNLDDGVHPNGGGYRLVLANLWPHLLPLLQTVEAGKKALPVQNKILVLGDDASTGYGLVPAKSWPGQLGLKLAQRGLPFTVVNASTTQETAQSARTRLPGLLSDHRPQLVILALGMLDWRQGRSLYDVRAHLREMILLLQKERIPLVLIGFRVPAVRGVEIGQGLAESYLDLAREFQLPLLPDLLEGIRDRKEFLQMDSNHPNEQGHGRIVERLWPLLENHPVLSGAQPVKE